MTLAATLSTSSVAGLFFFKRKVRYLQEKIESKLMDKKMSVLLEIQGVDVLLDLLHEVVVQPGVLEPHVGSPESRREEETAVFPDVLRGEK